MAEKQIPCPFCGRRRMKYVAKLTRNPKRGFVPSPNFGNYECRGCGARGPVGMGPSAALANWSRRADARADGE